MATADLTERIIDDTTSATYVYIGYCYPGNANRTDQPLWRILRIEKANGSMKMSGGNTNFDSIWDDRVTLSYDPVTVE